MKELDGVKKEKVEITDQKQQIKQLKFLGSLRPHRGQICFELEIATGKVAPAEFAAENVGYLNPKVSKKIIVKDGHLYVCAINLKNAQRKFVGMMIKLTQQLKKDK